MTPTTAIANLDAAIARWTGRVGNGDLVTVLELRDAAQELIEAMGRAKLAAREADIARMRAEIAAAAGEA